VNCRGLTVGNRTYASNLSEKLYTLVDEAGLSFD